MSMETLMPQLLNQFAEGRNFPDFAPEGTARPYIAWQQVGDQDFPYIEGGQAELNVARVQIVVWDETRLGASELMRAIGRFLTAAPQCFRPAGGLVTTFDETTDLRGARKDYYIHWQ